MNNRFWLGLVLTILFLVIHPIATAQVLRPQIVEGGSLERPFKQSHHDLPGGLDLDNPQEMMAQRLQELHELHQLQDQVQGLLKDDDFLKNIQQFSASELRQLYQKMQQGEGLGQDRTWDEFLNQAKLHKKLNERQIDILRRLAKRAEHMQTPRGEGMLNGSGVVSAPPSSLPPGSSSPTTSPPTADTPEPSLLDRMQEETTKWMMEHLDDVGGDVLEALTEVGATEEAAPLAELLRSMQQPHFSEMNVGEPAMGLSNSLSKMGAFLHERRGAWDEVRSIFRAAPSLPSFGDSSAAAAAVASDGGGWMPILLSLLMLNMVVVLICKMAARSQAQTGSGDAESWRLGPWPVSPSAVATRKEVIRAFEYVALLLLGPSAGACHHRALAERLAEQDSGNSARRQAAEMLACFYEQARYAPAGESLSPEELIDARNALCYLAGVTAP